MKIHSGIDEEPEFFADAPKVCAWRSALAERPSVRNAVRQDYPDLLRTFLLTRQSALSARLTPALA